MHKTFQVGAKTFVLDQAKAEAAFAAKKVINGRETMTFNLLPLKYQWAYDLYRKMKANHWEPEDIPMGKDIEQWRDEKVVSDVERWIIRMGIGYFSAAEGIVGDNIQQRYELAVGDFDEHMRTDQRGGDRLVFVGGGKTGVGYPQCQPQQIAIRFRR